ncbi:MAG: nucleoside triphosphate pyrophosphohydrolase [Oscillospiraceae bacterium]|nr:nucleoside triphosphate pyrophosphohydrolase [Oscillospiraceae bacterium]
MIDFAYKKNYTVEDLVSIVRILRSENGCPWDREQTHASIRRNFLEEAYEVVEAIDEKDSEHLREELGDVLMQVVFHTALEEEASRFDLNGVADGTCKKLIGRHPHIFGNETVSSAREVLENWDEIKRKEKGQKTAASAMEAVAKSLPALWRAEKIQNKAKKAGFDWPDISDALDKLSEELSELKSAVQNGENMEEELGDLIFSAVNVARFLRADPEEALNHASDKFIFRFQQMERIATKRGLSFASMSLDEMDVLWEQAKCL